MGDVDSESMRAVATLVAATCLTLTACTGPPSPERGRDNSATTAPSASASPQDFQVPLALAVHPSRTRSDVSLADARRIVESGTDEWADLGLGPGSVGLVRGGLTEGQATAADALGSAEDAVDAVVQDRNILALVPASAIDPRVRALTVAGVNPLRDPDSYPLVTTTADKPGSVVTMSIVGDIMLGRRVGRELERQNDPAAALRPLARRLASADVTVGNLESTLSRDGTPTQGGDSFGADPNVRDGLSLAGFDVLSLANNHVGDYGPRALGKTLDRLESAGLSAVGGGRTLAQARKPVVVERAGVRIGFIATDSIGETPAADKGRPGTNRLNAPPRTGPLDRAALSRIGDDIRALERQVDVVVVLAHWGTQYTNKPERSQRQIARVFARAGADLVVGGHPHWVQGWEMFGNTPVVHSLGNFVFDMDFMRETQEGVFLEVTSWGGKIMATDPVPYVIGDDFAPRPAAARRAKTIMGLIRETSRPPFDTMR